MNETLVETVLIKEILHALAEFRLIIGEHKNLSNYRVEEVKALMDKLKEVLA